MEFNSIERTSIANVLFAMMHADGNIDAREIMYFEQIQHAIAITNDEFERGKGEDLFRSLLILRSISNEKKIALGLMLHEMINADGKTTNEEMKLLLVVAHAIGLVELIQKLENQ